MSRPFFRWFARVAVCSALRMLVLVEAPLSVESKDTKDSGSFQSLTSNNGVDKPFDLGSSLTSQVLADNAPPKKNAQSYGTSSQVKLEAGLHSEATSVAVEQAKSLIAKFAREGTPPLDTSNDIPSPDISRADAQKQGKKLRVDLLWRKNHWEPACRKANVIEVCSAIENHDGYIALTEMYVGVMEKMDAERGIHTRISEGLSPFLIRTVVDQRPLSPAREKAWLSLLHLIESTRGVLFIRAVLEHLGSGQGTSGVESALERYRPEIITKAVFEIVSNFLEGRIADGIVDCIAIVQHYAQELQKDAMVDWWRILHAIRHFDIQFDVVTLLGRGEESTRYALVQVATADLAPAQDREYMSLCSKDPPNNRPIDMLWKVLLCDIRQGSTPSYMLQKYVPSLCNYYLDIVFGLDLDGQSSTPRLLWSASHSAPPNLKVKNKTEHALVQMYWHQITAAGFAGSFPTLLSLASYSAPPKGQSRTRELPKNITPVADADADTAAIRAAKAMLKRPPKDEPISKTLRGVILPLDSNAKKPKVDVKAVQTHVEKVALLYLAPALQKASPEAGMYHLGKGQFVLGRVSSRVHNARSSDLQNQAILWGAQALYLSEIFAPLKSNFHSAPARYLFGAAWSLYVQLVYRALRVLDPRGSWPRISWVHMYGGGGPDRTGAVLLLAEILAVAMDLFHRNQLQVPATASALVSHPKFKVASQLVAAAKHEEYAATAPRIGGASTARGAFTKESLQALQNISQETALAYEEEWEAPFNIPPKHARCPLLPRPGTVQAPAKK